MQIENLQLSYIQPDGTNQKILDIESLSLDKITCFTGPSGAGKTTLLYTLTGIEKPDRGKIFWKDQNIASFNERKRDEWRRQNVGFIFQDFNLFPGMNILQNIMIPSTFAKTNKKTMKKRALELLDKVGVPDYRRLVQTLSRGEQQRIAIARALLKNPSIIAADEPTASLDEANTREIIDLILSLQKEMNALLLIVTHDPLFLGQIPNIMHLDKGKLK